MLTVSEIKTFMDSDAASTKKRLAKVGLRYYEGRFPKPETDETAAVQIALNDVVPEE